LSFLLLFFFETKSWQKHQSLSDSNKLVDFNTVNKEFLPKKSSQKSSQKNPPKKILPKIPPKTFLKKKIQEKSKKFPPKIPK
jgi:hypothetical protein